MWYNPVMLRRTFLGFLGLLGFIPKAQAAPPQLVAPVEPAPATHTDLLTLFRDIEKAYMDNKGASILSADNPLALHLGWVVNDANGKGLFYGSIRLLRVKACLLEMQKEHADVLRDLIKSAEGRRRICEMLTTWTGRQQLHGMPEFAQILWDTKYLELPKKP